LLKRLRKLSSGEAGHEDKFRFARTISLCYLTHGQRNERLRRGGQFAQIVY